MIHIINSCFTIFIMKVVVALPGYNCQNTLRKTYLSIPMQYIDEVIYVDDNSTDNSINIAKSLHINNIICHSRNLGYGANQKTLYDKALELKADIIVLLHPDYQYDPLLIPELISKIKDGSDVVFASRIKHGKEAIRMGMPRYKYYANRLLTKIQNYIHRAGEISRDEYDRWRYYYPQYDDTQITAKVPSQELSDALAKALNGKIKE